MNVFDGADLIRLFDSYKELFTEQRDYLINLDGQVGDSDLGLTMNKAFIAAAKVVNDEGAEMGISVLLKTAGAAMARAAPSTMGTLTATGFMRSGKACDGFKELGTPEIAIFWRAFRDSVQERGKAALGDKTLLDVLDPIAVTLEHEAKNKTPLPQALNAAANVAKNALEKTKSMVAQHGKAAAFQGKTIGLQDAGATVGYFLIQGMASYANASEVLIKEA